MPNKQYLDYDGLSYLWSKILNAIPANFKTISVSDGAATPSITNIVADGKEDTLTLVQGANIVLTPDATNDKITISATSAPETFTNVSWDATNKAIQKTLNGTTSNVVTFVNGSGIVLNGTSTQLQIGLDSALSLDNNTTHLEVNATNKQLTWKTRESSTYYDKYITFGNDLSLTRTSGNADTGNAGYSLNINANQLKTTLGLGNAAYTDLATTYDASDTTQPVTGAIVASAMSASGLTKFTGIKANGSTVVPAGTASDFINFVNNGAITWAAIATTGGVNVTPTVAMATADNAGLLSTDDYAVIRALQDAAFKGVDTTIGGSPTNLNVPTSAAVAGYVADAIGDLEGIHFEVVQTLPATGDAGTIYLVPISPGSTNNSYDEYIWLTSTSHFEKIGTTDVDLSGYMTYTVYNTLYMSNADIDAAIAAGELL